MPPVAVRILHREPAVDAGPLERSLATMRVTVAHRVRAMFGGLGADAAIVAGPPDDRSFGERLRALVAGMPPDAGLIVLGSGAAALARADDLRPFVEAAASGERKALVNNRYSADLVAIGCAGALAGIPDLVNDNALPRWLAEDAGYRVVDLRGRWRLQVDLDTPLDGVLLGLAVDDAAALTDRLARARALARDPRAELLIAGRTSGATIRWLERATRARVRALIEERGLRTSRAGQRPPVSVLGALLDRDGPGSLGRHVARLGDAALIDSRVLMAHGLGADEAAWPVSEDRFASDLLLPDRISDPWLRELTEAALDAPVPVVLGGHTLVGPGIRLALGSRR